MLCVVLLIQLYFYFKYFFQIIYFNPSKVVYSDSRPPVSVVICARDEHHNLTHNLPLILEQNYPEFQVVLVDDCSEDETEDYLKQLKASYSNLYVTRINPDPVFKHGKKLALTIGIKAAKYDHLLLTDADCTPMSKNWMSEMIKCFTNEKQIVLGYSPVKKEKGWLNHYLRYENIFTAIQYFGFALAKKPYMGVGRNLAYKKELFFQQKGFARHSHLLSGDDDLFVNQASNKINTAVQFSAESAMLTVGSESWKTFRAQRKRHVTTGYLYRNGDKWRLGLEIVSRYLMLATTLFLIISSSYWWIALSVFMFRGILLSLCFNISARKLGQNMFPASILLYDILSPAINGLFSLSNRVKPKSIKWK